MPLTEHPLDESWGYQGTGYYSATSRYGVPKDLMYLIDQCHQNDIGVILDWVPGHICKDAHGLYMFDGEPLYEYDDYNIRENVVWGTVNLDLGQWHHAQLPVVERPFLGRLFPRRRLSHRRRFEHRLLSSAIRPSARITERSRFLKRLTSSLKQKTCRFCCSRKIRRRFRT
ncbi:MAG: alpha-amylase family glycosyl hydrolase [Bacillus subtilis]|nr:alpha-amylase family glycosyl hydrolase [Bacillus subtilis]